MPTKKCKNLEWMILHGWHPTHHTEFLDCYNSRAIRGGVIPTVTARLDSKNQSFIVIEHDQR